MNNFPSAKRLETILHFNPNTGIFTWRHREGTDKGSRIFNKRWAGKQAGWLSNDGYIQIEIDGVRFKAHRLAWHIATGDNTEFELDHINGLRDDNRICNLRPASRIQNARNGRKRDNNTSGEIGVYLNKPRGKWQAYITVNYKTQYLGIFDLIEDAVNARKAAEEKYFGNYAFRARP